MMSYTMFKHLVSAYNNNIFNVYNDNSIRDYNCIKLIYIVYLRYFTIMNGSNQASILPSFKKLIKDYLGVKIELFGSALNTSMSKFGSIFPDIEYAFGSLGNYFDINIKRGYFEINPVFDNCLINDIFIKTYNELKKAELHNQPLLFLLIIPSTYFKKNQMLNDIIPFIKFNSTIPKDKF